MIWAWTTRNFWTWLPIGNLINQVQGRLLSTKAGTCDIFRHDINSVNIAQAAGQPDILLMYSGINSCEGVSGHRMRPRARCSGSRHRWSAQMQKSWLRRYGCWEELQGQDHKLRGIDDQELYHSPFTGYQPYALVGRTVVPQVHRLRHPGPPALLQVKDLY